MKVVRIRSEVVPINPNEEAIKPYEEPIKRGSFDFLWRREGKLVVFVEDKLAVVRIKPFDLAFLWPREGKVPRLPRNNAAFGPQNPRRVAHESTSKRKSRTLVEVLPRLVRIKPSDLAILWRRVAAQRSGLMPSAVHTMAQRVRPTTR